MDRFDNISMRVAFEVLSKERPLDAFGAMFFDLRLKVRDLKEKWSQQAKESLRKALVEDLTGKGYEVVSAEFALGQYRGSRFMTSAKVSVKVGTEVEAKKLATYLLKFSPKFNLKSWENGIAAYNIR